MFSIVEMQEFVTSNHHERIDIFPSLKNIILWVEMLVKDEIQRMTNIEGLAMSGKAKKPLPRPEPV